jgi:carbonic anhydrase/acetyltransferase-like protein (isoleucine patch superfamily)
VFNGATWTKIGPAITQGLTGAVLPATLTDTNSVAHTVLKQDIGNATVVVASNDAFAIPNADDFYTRFNVIKQGLSLPNVTAEGISGNIDPLTGNRNGYLFWGTSGSALGLVKTDSGTGLNTFISANEYLQRSELSSFSGNLTVNNSDGVLVGIGGVLKMHVTESTKGNISVVNGNQLKFNILNNGDPYYNIFYLTTGTNNTPKILPNPSANVSLGDSGTGNSFSSLYVKTINATTFAATTVTASLFVGSGAGLSTGTISNNSLVNNSITITNGTGIQGGGVVALGGVLTLTNGGVTSLVGTTYQISATSPTGGVTLSLPQNINTTATVTFKELKLTTLRTVNTTTTATIYGNWILGPGATFQATYADVAERYASDADYAPGTALVIGGTAEVTMTTKHGDTARAGIVSTNPAYRLNSTAGNDITHPYIALKGKVPCKVVGPISKGDFVVTSTRAGFAERMQDGDSPLAVLGRALSSFDG